MKTVYYSRHAKSSWEYLNLKDIHRPLNKRGKQDAPLMAKQLKLLLKGQKINAILSSTSQRTRETLIPFAETFGISADKVVFDPSLYLADADYLVEALFQLSDEFDSVLLFAHNPGITDLASRIASFPVDNVPTCGLFQVEFAANSWTEVQVPKSKMGFFTFPKMYK